MKDKNQTIEFIDFARQYSVETLGLNRDHGFEKRSNYGMTIYFVLWMPKNELNLNYQKYRFKSLACLIKYVKSIRNYTTMRKAEAYGGSECQITSFLLESTPYRIALVIPHEKWHCFVKDYSCDENLMIEESMGDAIALNEAINIVEKFYGKDSEEYKEAIEDREYYRKRAKISKMLIEELNELYETGSFYEKDVEEIMSKYNKVSEETIGESFDSVVEALDSYSYDALYPLAEDIYLKHGYEKGREIFISALELAEKNGFVHGVKELLKHSDLDEEEYLKVINVF